MNLTNEIGFNWTSGNSSQSQPGPPATYGQQVAMTVGIACLGIWSTAGNLLTIAAIISRPKMRTKSNMFILSLAFSDFLSGAVASPLWLYRRTWGFYPWNWGQFACRLYWGMDETTSYCTAMHIASFAIWRYIAVKFPHTLIKIKLVYVQIWVFVLWIVATIFGGIIYNTFYESIEKPQDGGVYSHWPMCSIKFRDNGISKFKTYYTFSSTTFLMLPMLILLVTSVFIGYEIVFKGKFKSQSRSTKEKRAVYQLSLISASFLLGYLPMTFYMTWTIRVSNKPKNVDYWFAIAAYFCLRVSECINPMVYNISSQKMRETSKYILMRIFCCTSTTKMPGNASSTIAFPSKSKLNSSTNASTV